MTHPSAPRRLSPTARFLGKGIRSSFEPRNLSSLAVPAVQLRAGRALAAAAGTFQRHIVPTVRRSFRYNHPMSAALGLFRLQQVDTRIGQMEARRRKIQETLENDSELQAAIQRVKAAEHQAYLIDQQRRAAEEGARDQQVKIQQVEASLYGGKVHNPKELQDLQADVVSLKKHLATVEDQQLDAMLQLESSQTALQQAQADLERVRSRLGEENRHLLDEQAALQRDLQGLAAEHQAAVSAVDPRMLNTYEAIRAQRRGVAVAEVADNACGACGTTLTAALQQSARHAADLVYCPTCGRVLFAL